MDGRGMGCSLGLAALVLAWAGGAQAAGEPIRLSYDGGGVCPGEEAFTASVRRLVPDLRLASPGESGRVFRVAVTHNHDGSLSGRLDVEKDGQPRGAREVHGRDCDEVTGLLAFAVGLALGAVVEGPATSSAPPAAIPVAAPPPPASVSVAGPQPPVPVPVAAQTSPPPVPTKVRDEETRLFKRPMTPFWRAISAHSSVAGDLGPGATWSVGGAVELGGQLGTLSPSYRLGVDYAWSGSAAAEGAKVTFSDVLGLVAVCSPPTVWWGEHFAAESCVRGDLGARSVTATNIVNGHTVNRFWADVGPELRLRLRPGARTFVELAAGLFFVVTQTQVDLSPSVEVTGVGLVGGRGEVSVGFEFP
jgi:hypothetical protein